MDKIFLKPITSEEFSRWRAIAVKTYAAEKQKSGLLKNEAEEVANTSFNSLLPENEKTPNHYLFSVVESDTGLRVGTLWWGLQKQGNGLSPWIYDILLEESARGKGYGRATMLAAEASVRENGHRRLGLHVFGHNQVARNLYDSMGFKTTSVVMLKEL